VTFCVTSFPKNDTFWPRRYKTFLNGKKCDDSAGTQTCFSLPVSDLSLISEAWSGKAIWAKTDPKRMESGPKIGPATSVLYYIKNYRNTFDNFSLGPYWNCPATWIDRMNSHKINSLFNILNETTGDAWPHTVQNNQTPARNGMMLQDNCSTPKMQTRDIASRRTRTEQRPTQGGRPIGSWAEASPYLTIANLRQRLRLRLYLQHKHCHCATKKRSRTGCNGTRVSREQLWHSRDPLTCPQGGPVRTHDSVCCFVLLNWYWEIVMVPGFPRVNRPQIITWGLPDPHPSPWLCRWLYQSPPLPLQTDPTTNTVDNKGQALAAPCLGRSKVCLAS